VTLFYRNAYLYEALMVCLYGRHYWARYETIADLIPQGSSVLDLCCGPAILFDRYLRHKSVEYTGLDLSAPFIKRLNERGGYGQVWNIRDDKPLPEADYVIMHASLYQFLPDAGPVMDRMLQAAKVQVIVSEPVRNLADSKLALVRKLSQKFTDAGDGKSAHRFTEASLERFLDPYLPQVEKTLHTPGGREKVVMLKASLRTHSTTR